MAQGLERIPLAIDSDFQYQPVRAKFPDEAPPEIKLVSFVPDEVQVSAPAAQSRTVGQITADTAYGFAKGAGSLVKGLGWLTNSDTLQQAGQVAEDFWGEKQTAELQRQLDAVGKAEGVTGTVSALWDNPGAIGDYIATSLPMMIPGMGVGSVGARGIVAFAGNSARSAALRGGATEAAAMQAGRIAAEKAAEKSAMRFAVGANMLGEGGVSGGVTGADVEQFMLSKGATPEQAKAEANKAALLAGAWTTAGAGIGAGMETRAMLGRLKDTGIKGLAKNVGKEALEEAIQNPGEDYASYQAKVKVDPTQTFDPGKSATLGAVTGGVMGAGFHAAGRIGERMSGKQDDGADDPIPAADIGAGPSGSGGVSGEFIPADPRSQLPPPGPGAGSTYDQGQALLPAPDTIEGDVLGPETLPPGQRLLEQPAIDGETSIQGGEFARPALPSTPPTERQFATARGLLNHSPKASPELLQRLMRVDQDMAAMLFNHWQGQKNGEVTGNQGAEVSAEGSQGQGADDAGSGILDSQRDGAMPSAMGDTAGVAAQGGEPGMAVGAAGPDAITPLDVEAHGAATSPFNATPQPTEAQKQAGNYKVGRIKFHGMDISIENPAGSVRSGTNKDGKAWENTLQHHYGYIRGTTARDGDHVDAFIKPGAQTARTAYVIDQIDPKTGKYDEAKVILGADSEADAQAIYHANYEQGWQGMGAITAMPMEQFKDWIKTGKTKKPLAYTEPKEIRTASRTPKTASSLLQAIVNRGGISREIMSDVGADTAGRYMPGLFTKTGTTDLSALAGYLFDEDGFHQIYQDSPIGPSRELEDLITRALGGKKILSTTAMEKGMQAEENSKLKEKAQRLGIKTVARKIEDIAADVARAEEESILDEETRLEEDALDAYNELVDALNAAVGEHDAEGFIESLTSRYQDDSYLTYLRNAIVAIKEKLNAEVQSTAKPDETATGQAGSGDETGRAQGGTDALLEEARPPLALSSQSEEELAARDRAAQTAEAQRLKDEQAAESKRQADAERGSFNLTGSDRPADVLAAQGQEGLFDQPTESEKQPADPVAESLAPAPSEPGDDGVATIQGGAAADTIAGKPVADMSDDQLRTIARGLSPTYGEAAVDKAKTEINRRNAALREEKAQGKETPASLPSEAAKERDSSSPVAIITKMRDAMQSLIDAKENANVAAVIPADSKEGKEARTMSAKELSDAESLMREAFGAEEATPMLKMSASELYDLYDAVAGRPFRQQEKVGAGETVTKDQGPHFASGVADFKTGKPRELPSYFTKTTGKNPRDWYRGWDEAKASAQPDASIAGKPVSEMSDGMLNQIAKSSQPAVEKAKAEVAKRKKPKADPLAAVREFYAPGNIIHVDYWNQYDKVLEFKEGDLPGQWNVKVQQVKKDGDQWVPKDDRMEPPRWHATAPGKDKIVDRVAMPTEQDRDSFTLERLNGDAMEPVTFERGEYVRYTLSGKDQFGDIDGISHARREFSVDGLWYPFGFAYKAERQAPAKAKDAVPLSSVVEAVNKKHGEGLTDADRVPTQDQVRRENPNIKTTLAEHDATMDRLRDGTATLAEYKAAFQRLQNSTEELTAEFAAMKKDDILKHMGGQRAHNYKSDTKDKVVAAAVRDLMDDFSIGRGISYVMGGRDAYANAVRAQVERTTDADLAEYAEHVKSMRAARTERVAQMTGAMKDPKTLADFKMYLDIKAGDTVTREQARMMLTPEQRVAFDELSAKQSREERKGRADQQRTEVRAPGEAVGASEIIKTKHTKHGHDLWQFTLERRVPPDEFKSLVMQAKRMGGDYSSYRGNGAIPGWQFRTEEAAIAFRALVAGDTAAAKEVMQTRRDDFEDDRSQTAVERLTEMADRLEERADESLNRDRKENTDRRARMAASAEAAANSDKSLAKTMRNIAQAIESGKTKFLDRVRQKAQVEMLRGFLHTAKANELRAKFPNYGDQEKHRSAPPTAETADYVDFPRYTAFRSDLATMGRQMLDIDGAKKTGAALLKVADDVSAAYLAFAKEHLHQVSTFKTGAGKGAVFASRDDAETAIKRSGFKGKAVVLPFKRGQNIIIMSPSAAKEAGIWKGDDDKRITLTPDFGEEVVAKVKEFSSHRISMPYMFESVRAERARLKSIGIETAAELRAALREFMDLRAAPPEVDKIKQMERAMIGRKNDGLDFFPTPASVADELVQAAGIEEGMAVLEPSAGMGHIAERIRAAGVDPDVVEMASDRRELLEAKGFRLVGSDFMDMSPRGFTYGDVFRTPDGTLGVMRGSGGMGSNRVGLDPLDANGNPEPRRMGWYDRDELEGVKKRAGNSGYDRIIMNPPFSDRRDAEHVQHAYTLLKPGGRLVAIMGEGVFFGQDKKAQAFRNWLEEVGGTSEKLEEGTFLDPSLPVNTGVNARMVVIEKPGSDGIELTPAMRAEPDAAITEGAAGNGMESRSRAQGSATTESTRAIQSIVDKFLKQFAGAADLDIRVVRTVADIPERFRPSPFAEGTFNDDAGRIYLIAMNLKHANGQVNTGRVWQVLMHEAVGHAGLAKMMGSRFDGILKEVMRAARAKGEVGEDIYEPGHPDYATIEAVRLRYTNASDEVLAEEVLARMAETDPGRTLFGYVRAVVRQWLRDMARAAGITLDVTTAELNDLVAQASRYMRRGDGVAQGVDVDALGVADMAVGGMASKATGMESRVAPTAGQPKEPRTGFLDTILRKAGGELAAKITGPAYDKLTAFLGGKVPEGIKAGMVSDYGLDESYVDRRTGMQTEQQKAARQTKTFVEGMMGLDRAQSRVAYQWLNNRGVEADRLMAQLPPESQQVLKDIKIQIAKLTIEAVRLGQLDAETAERNFLAYLHRSYAKYDLNTDDKTWKAERAKAIKILGDQYKGRGLKMDVDPDRIHSTPGWWQDEMKGKRVKVLKNEAGRFAFVADGTAIPPNLSGYKVEGVWEIRARKADNRITLWRDFTQDERTMMGELDEAKYAVARTLFMMNRDIEVGRFHEWVADEYAKTPEEAEEEGLQMADASDSMMRAFTPDEWVTVPTSKIPGIGVFKYGALAGMVVPGPVWNDIRQISAGRFEPFGAAYASILRAWKLSKTALTPTTHVNNIMGNFVMADMHDVGARDAIAAVRLMVAAANGDKDAKAMLDRFEDSGATQGMFTTHELKKEVLEPLLQQLREEVGMADDEAAILKVSAIMSLALHGQFGEAWAGAKAAAKQSKAGRVTGAVVTKAQDYYQAEDSVFRLAAFLKSIDEGKTDLEAGKLSRKAFLDYHINAPWINAMRGTAMPFIAFAYRAIPMLAETAARKPWKIAKYMLVAGGLNALAYAMLGADADEDKERAYLPDEKAGRLWGIVPKLIRMPWNRESKLRDGRTTSDPVFLDVRRWIPVGDVVDYGQDKTALPMIPQPLIPGGPLIMAAEFLVNKSAFTGKELTKETDTWVEKAAKVGGHFYKGFAPNVPIPYSGTWAGTKIDNAVKGKEDPLGRAYPVPEAIASGFGLKLERYPVDTLQRNTVLDMKGKLRELEDERRQAARDYGRNGMERIELDQKISEIVVKKNKAVEDYKAKERKAMGR